MRVCTCVSNIKCIYSGKDVLPWAVDLSSEVHVYMHFWNCI